MWVVVFTACGFSIFFYNSVLDTRSVTLRKVVQDNLSLQPLPSACWTAQVLACVIPMQEFTADWKHRMRGVWRDAELVDPNTHNNKLATYHSYSATPFSSNNRMPTIVPRYLHLDLSKHVMRNVSRLRLRAHTLKVEAAAWLEDGSRVCDQCPGEDEHVQNEVHAL